jgi:hypothetical protein
MSVGLTQTPKFTALDSNGNPWAGAKLYTYETGTTTPKTSWTDATRATPNLNPIILDSYGQADVWIDSVDGNYRLKLVDPEGNTIWTVDEVEGKLGVVTAGLDPGDVLQVDQAEASTATATTTILGTATTKHLLTGVATITGFTGTAGVTYSCRVRDGVGLVHHATNLIITQGGASIVAAAGDTFDVQMITGTTCRIVNYIRAIGNVSAAGNLRDIQIFTSSDTYTKPSWLKFAIVEVQAAGGGGAGGGSIAGQLAVGRGGCGGGYGRGKLDAGDIGATEAVTVGAGGTGTTSGTATDGGASSFGTHITANGGTAGNNVNNVTGESYVQSNPGAVASGGNILNISGGGVEAAWCSVTLNLAIASKGGDSFMGRGGRSQTGDGVTAGGGRGYGSGGGGAGMRDGDTTNSRGGDGAPGKIVVYEYE